MICSLEAERALLGSLLLVGGGPLPQGLEPHHMFYDKHERLYALIVHLAGEGRGFDTLCIERALIAKAPAGQSEQQASQRRQKVREFLDLLLAEARVSMIADHARLVTEAWCFRSLKSRALEIQDAAMRGDSGALGRALAAAHEVFGVLERLSGGPALRVISGEERAA